MEVSLGRHRLQKVAQISMFFIKYRNIDVRSNKISNFCSLRFFKILFCISLRSIRLRKCLGIVCNKLRNMRTIRNESTIIRCVMNFDEFTLRIKIFIRSNNCDKSIFLTGVHNTTSFFT